MKEYGKIFADRLEALRQHGLRVCTDDHPIAVFDGQAQKIIADGAADEVSLHMLPILKLSIMPSEEASDGIVSTGGYFVRLCYAFFLQVTFVIAQVVFISAFTVQFDDLGSQ